MNSFLAFLLLGVTAVTAAAEPVKKTPPTRTRDERAATPRAPIIGQPFDDGEVLRYLEAEGRKLFKAGKVKPITTAPRRCSLRLPLAPTEKISLPEAAKRAEAATVVLGEFFREKESVAFSSAAGGFFLSESGAIVTSLHVLREKDSRGFVALLRDGRVLPVLEALAADPVEDLVVLQLELPEGGKVVPLPLAAEPAPIGGQVAVMSHPEEHFYLLTTGVVGRHTIWRETKGDAHFMSINADFAKGSSGCPVFDERGVVVGVVNNTESIYYDDDGKRRQIDLQMVVKNATPSWVLRHLVGE
jgi:S1-C subfamily serine protease